MPYTRQAFCYDGDVGVRTFGRRGAYRLIGTAVTCVALTGLLRLWTGTVLCNSQFNQSLVMCR